MKTFLLIFGLLLIKLPTNAQCDSITSFTKALRFIEKVSPNFHYSYDSSNHIYKFQGGEIFYPVKTDKKTGLAIEYYFSEDYSKMIDKISDRISICLGKRIELSKNGTQILNSTIQIDSINRRIEIWFSN